ncbi:MAG: hypothetical protein KF784_09325 [Fimbriimonadaceae bacterium]|nr:hypothetical protein [Fimbriimonadaceae bacterium]
MKLRILLLVAMAAFAVSVRAQVAIGPFAGAINENFNAMVPGSYVGFAGYAGAGGFNRLNVGGLLVVNNNPGLLPMVDAPNNMFGRGTDVQIRFQQVWKRFGGVFRVPNAGIVVTTATFQFYRFGLPVGVPVAAPVNMAGWVWIGYDCGPIGGYDEVRIYGNGTLPGYVGMDLLRSA